MLPLPSRISMSLTDQTPVLRWGAALLLVNLLITGWLAPWVQASANSHMNAGPSVAMTFVAIAVVLAGHLLFFKLQRPAWLMVASLLAWAVWLSGVYCQGCAASG